VHTAGLSWNFTFFAPERQDGQVTMEMNGLPFALTGNLSATAEVRPNAAVPPGYSVAQVTPSQFEVHGPDNLVVEITKPSFDKFLSLSSKVTYDYCSRSSGIMGSCDPSVDPRKVEPPYEGPWETCSQWGMGHIQPFNSTAAPFQFPGQCEYVLARHARVMETDNGAIDASYDIQSRHTPCGDGHYCLKDVAILVTGADGTLNILLRQNGDVEVGLLYQVNSFPAKLVNGVVIEKIGAVLTVVLFNEEVTVRFDGLSVKIRTATPAWYLDGAMTGLCGLTDPALTAGEQWTYAIAQINTDFTIFADTVACSDPATRPSAPVCNSNNETVA
jgi:hypothetical protein